MFEAFQESRVSGSDLRSLGIASNYPFSNDHNELSISEFTAHRNVSDDF
jgi:hypothetical protein